ncbi:phosphoribosylformimino-5-aminoimidazole carboxamide ribotide isomerase [Candidatus Entotheonella serta]|nr:phosphoribosylformimino-5-aminoimidazole carboxamide ribotide isomerase [Candidatus Entotheonella serta]
MRFRPCIDLRSGRVVQIVGGTLVDGREPTTNFESDRSPASYARMYLDDALPGGHVIALGPGNHEAALSALRAFPGGMQMGGGVTPENASVYLEAGASHVIVTSYVFRDGCVDMARLEALAATVGTHRLVLDLSCRQRSGAYWVVTDRWQRFTDVQVNQETLQQLSAYCDEFLVHGVDVEGKRAGMEADLVRLLGDHSPLPVTYAGGAKSLDDLATVKALGSGRVDLTIASALDIFGGHVPYREVVAWQRREEAERVN